MKTWHIHIKGQVQGVGFRPFIHDLAEKAGILGQVCNRGDGVHIHLCAEVTRVQLFISQLKERKPPRAVITSIECHIAKDETFESFEIVDSPDLENHTVLLSPDFGICQECSDELMDILDRRFGYPFITCTQCGPRLSVITALPYDRPRTSMSSFNMCLACSSEYRDLMDRRYFSQTNSCEACGISLTWNTAPDIPNKDFHEQAAQLIDFGSIVAIKSTGGFLLVCDATNVRAVEALRTRKRRPTKPFALLYKDIKSARTDAIISQAAAELLTSEIRPIVICPAAKSSKNTQWIHPIAPGLDTVGIMLPGDPLLYLIAALVNRPLVVTSANLHQSPIIYDNHLAEAQLSGIADYVLSHNRDITMPQDDSVLTYSPYYQQKIVLRRSRGLAPTYWHTSSLDEQPLLALGADIKGAFALSNRENIYISQYLGNLESYEAQQQYKYCLDQYLSLTGIKPKIVLHDVHRGYFSSTFKEFFPDAQHIAIQHHEAHFAAILWEHQLHKTPDPILGVLWDGLGMGKDGQLWGGEFFEYHQGTFERFSHFEYFDYILGDKMSHEPRLSALSLFRLCDGAQAYLEQVFDDREWQLYNRLLDRKTSLNTSSVGRIFDAVACMLDLITVQRHEGEAAMHLEKIAKDYFVKNRLDFNETYPIEPTSTTHSIATYGICQGIVDDLIAEVDKKYIAAKFFRTLVALIDQQANYGGYKKIAFSGGVFQNGLLVDLIIHHCGSRFELYFHNQVSPNDENICLGQLSWWHIKTWKSKQTNGAGQLEIIPIVNLDEKYNQKENQNELTQFQRSTS